jgi:hypothetical protein
MRKNIVKILNNADEQTKQSGINWYSDAKFKCSTIATTYGVSTELVASVVSALSPRNRWSRNIVDADNVVSHVFQRTPLRPCATYGANVRKAIKLCNESLSNEQRLKLLNGEKIKSFFLNIIGDDSRVTVDSWIMLAYAGKYKETKKRKALTLTLYRKIEKDIKIVAKETGIKPYELQAIVWLQFQKDLTV